MIGPLSLGKRAFLLAFVPLCVTLAGSFVAINQAIRSEIQNALSESMQRSEATLQRVTAEARQRAAGLLRVLGENPGLKASIALLGQTGLSPEDRAQARNTIEDQLRELSVGLGYDLFALRDSAGRIVAALSGPQLRPLSPGRLTVPTGATLARVEGPLYEIVTVPITVDGDPLGELMVGKRFDLRSLGYAGELVLLEGGSPAVTTLPAAMEAPLAARLLETCPPNAAQCELNWNGRDYLALPIRGENLGAGRQLWSLQSIDDQMEPFTRNLGRTCLKIGVCGSLIALVISLAASGSISRPLRELLGRLKRGRETGEIPSDLATTTSSYEVNLLAAAINQAASAADARSRELTAEIEQHRETQQRLQAAKDLAEEASRAKSGFLATMSHELRTPLNAVIGYSEMVMEDLKGAGRADLLPDLERIRSAGVHQLGLIDAILDMSKFEAGKMPLHLEEVDVRSLIDEVAGTVRPLAARNANRLEARCQQDIGIITADCVKMRQALLNLLSNACKFTERGEVRIDAYRQPAPEGERVVFEVSDTGIGITAEQMGRLFQPFSQGDASTTRKYGGTGLGLAISKRFCEMMGGDIQVASRPGAGSRFTVTIPANHQGRGPL